MKSGKKNYLNEDGDDDDDVCEVFFFNFVELIKPASKPASL